MRGDERGGGRDRSLGGIARACVSQLRDPGLAVLAAVRTDSQAAGIPSGVETFRLDVSEPAVIDAAVEAIRSFRRPLRALVDNAGASSAGAIEDLPTPLNAPYCTAEHALEAFSDSLRLELAPSGIPVCVVTPGQMEAPTTTRPRSRYFVGADSRGAYLLGRVAPGALRRRFMRAFLGFA